MNELDLRLKMILTYNEDVVGIVLALLSEEQKVQIEKDFLRKVIDDNILRLEAQKTFIEAELAKLKNEKEETL